MPFVIERHSETGAVVVKGAGTISAADHDDMLRALTNACAVTPSSRVVLDLSNVNYVPTADEARALAQHVVLLAKSRCLIAIVGRQGAQFGIARMVETISTIRDVVSAAFTTLDEALAWVRATPE